jgi:hypothetical protein
MLYSNLHNNRRWLITTAAGILGAAFLGAAFYAFGRGFDWTLFASTFSGLHWGWLAGACGFSLFTYWGRALRWRVLIRPVKPHPSLWGLFVATSIGFTGIVLFGRPGEMLRPYLIAVKEKVSVSSQIAAWFLERVYDLLAALLIFGFALSRVKSSGIQVGESLQWVLATGGHAVAILSLICLGVLIMLGLFTDVARRRIHQALEILPGPRGHRVRGMVDNFVEGIGSTRSKSAMLQVFLYTMLEWAIITACYFCFFRASDLTAAMSIMDILIFIGFAAFGSVVQIPGVGGGPQIAAFVVLTQLFGMGLEAAAGMSLMIWCITFVVVVPFGLILAFHEGINWRKLKELEEKAEHIAEEGGG